MNAPGHQLPHRRYRRRILGWGAVGVISIFAVGAVIFMTRVEDDLERRVVAEFDDAQVGPVTAAFSGQDGTLECRRGPVEIPDAVLTRARGLWGVSSLEVDDSCNQSASQGDDGGDSGNDASDDPVDTTAPAPTTAAPPVTEPIESTPPTVPVDTDSVASLVANDSQFSTLRGLLADTGLDTTLAGTGPFTLFAPTNGAFQALGPDTIAELGRDTDVLATVLSHHAIAGELTSADLVDGDIEMLDESSVTIDSTDGIRMTSGDSVAAVTEPDLVAENGVVHAIDQVLIPEGLAIGATTDDPLLTAAVVDGQIFLRGTVANEAQRTELVTAAGLRVDAANVVDELVVETGAASAEVNLDGFANLASLMLPNLISGEAVLTASDLTLDGVYASDDQNTALTSVAADVTFNLTQRADATDDDAVSLEADLNALVAANPILFDPNSATISDESAAVLDRVAALASRIGGVAIEIQGHTDTDGLPATNQQLSEARAAAVSVALVDRGNDAESLTATGFGGTEPILDDSGAEDKDASRRVEFVVTVQPASS